MRKKIYLSLAVVLLTVPLVSNGGASCDASTASKCKIKTKDGTIKGTGAATVEITVEDIV